MSINRFDALAKTATAPEQLCDSLTSAPVSMTGSKADSLGTSHRNSIVIPTSVIPIVFINSLMFVPRPTADKAKATMITTTEINVPTPKPSIL